MHLSHDLVTQATRQEPAYQFLCVKIVREPEFNPACLVQSLQLIHGERQVETCKIVLQLRKLSGSDDGND
jgi:hypothetical protein